MISEMTARLTLQHSLSDRQQRMFQEMNDAVALIRSNQRILHDQTKLHADIQTLLNDRTAQLVRRSLALIKNGDASLAELAFQANIDEKKAAIDDLQQSMQNVRIKLLQLNTVRESLQSVRERLSQVSPQQVSRLELLLDRHEQQIAVMTEQVKQCKAAAQHSSAAAQHNTARVLSIERI